MQTYRRLATTASSTSRSASSSMHHPHPASVSAASHNHSRLSRSSSSTSSSVISPSMTPVDAAGFSTGYGRMGSLPIARDMIRNSSYASTAGTTSDYTHAELETIAESLLAHVTFGPYHLASSPVPSSHLRLAMSSKENMNTSSSSTTTTNSVSITGSDSTSSATPTLNQLQSSFNRPSSRRHFEGKEGSERNGHNNHNNHPRARFTIGGESERGRGMARKSVGLSIRDLNGGDSFGFERGREMRGRSGSVKELQ